MLSMVSGQTYLIPDENTFIAPDGSSWNFSETNYLKSVQVDICFGIGDKISGLAQFATYDSPDFADYATVTVGGLEVWQNRISDVFDFEAYNAFGISSGDWENWSWTAPTSGRYTVSLDLFGDDELESFAYFDNFVVTRSAVPDGGYSVGLLLCSLGALILLRRRLNCRG